MTTAPQHKTTRTHTHTHTQIDEIRIGRQATHCDCQLTAVWNTHVDWQTVGVVQL